MKCFFSVFPTDNAASEGVLASFFNSLLSKKTGSPGSPGAGGAQSTAKKSGRAGCRGPGTLAVQQGWEDGEQTGVPTHT